MPTVSCTFPTCRLATDGVCVLGHDPIESCPNQQEEEVTLAQIPEEFAVAEDDGALQSRPVPIASGEAFTPADLASFGRSHTFRKIVLVGEQRVGKTTLVASLFGVFCKGPIEGVSFTQSRTIVGFARRHHLALLNSNSAAPKAPRTSRADAASFLHLGLRTDAGYVQHLIISDRSGEAYGDASANTDLISDFHEFRGAERICFLLDAPKALAPGTRTAYVRKFKQLIHALLDNGLLPDNAELEVLVTKIDVVLTGEDHAARFDQLTQLEDTICREFAETGLVLSTHRIAALPTAKPDEQWIGMKELLMRWSSPKRKDTPPPERFGPRARQVDRLLEKALAAELKR